MRAEPAANPAVLRGHAGPLRAAPFTVVELDAHLRLAGLRYEDVLTLPRGPVATTRSGPSPTRTRRPRLDTPP